MSQLPAQGLSHDEVMARLEAFRADDINWRSGRAWAYVYDAGEGAQKVCEDAFAGFLWENALDPTVFPSMLRLENELVGLVARHLHAPEGAAGCYASGGTESIMLAVKGSRERHRRVKQDNARLNIVLPETAHAAFQKAALYLDLEVRLIPVDPHTFKAVPDAMAAAVDPHTCLIVGSAPSYAHGVIDPIADLGAIALQHDLWLHVDACVGGWLLPWFERLGAPLPRYDFRVPGVSSMSCDLHKYGFAPKGASILVLRDKSLRPHHMYACATWSGYTLINLAVQSSKGGGPLAAAWAALNFMGDDGYEALASRMLTATREIVAGIDAIDDLRVLGTPEMNLIAITSDTVNIFHVADEMTERGWYVQPQLSFGASPANIHLSVNPKGQPHVPALLADFKASCEAARALPSGQLKAVLGDALASLDPATVDPSAIPMMLAMAGITGTGLPKRMAEINEVLDALTPPLRELLLVGFVNELYRPE